MVCQTQPVETSRACAPAAQPASSQAAAWHKVLVSSTLEICDSSKSNQCALPCQQGPLHGLARLRLATYD